MIVTKKKLRQIIKEELNKVLNENVSKEEMLALANVLLSGGEGMSQAAMLGEDLGIITNYKFTDESRHTMFLKKERYKHTFDLDPEFAKAIAESMLSLERAGQGVVDGYDGVFRDMSMFDYDLDEGKVKHRYSFWINPSGKASGVLSSTEYLD